LTVTPDETRESARVAHVADAVAVDTDNNG
jgi:hypothetical protein